MKKYLYYLGAVVFGAFTLASCSADNEPEAPDADMPTVSHGVYVLNQGNFYSNIEGGLNVIDYNSDATLQNVFKSVNGRSLGDTPQCGVAYGSRIYLGVYASNTIEVINRSTYKSEKQISLAENSASKGSQPRSMVATGGYVYFSCYDGYVARLDTVTLTIDKSVQVGPNPEIMALYNNKLYVPNSDGMNYPNYGTTASEIDLASFTVTKTFTVPQNPARFYSTANGLYLLSNGNYGDEAAALYKVGDDYSCTKIAEATIAEYCGDFFALINDPFYGAVPAEYKRYDLNTSKVSEWSVTPVDSPNGIFYDSLADKIIITSYILNGGYASYDLPGYANLYNSNGTFVRKYNIGVGPSCIFTNAE